MKKRYLFAAAAMFAAAGVSAQEPAEALTSEGASVEETAVEEKSELEALREEVRQLHGDVAETQRQNDFKKLWGRQKSWNIGFVNSNWSPEDGDKLKCNYGFSMDLRKTWYVTPAFADMVRIGIDAKWFDITYVNYKTEWYDDSNGEVFYQDYGYDYDDDFGIGDLGSHQLDLGMGVGVSATVAPFVKFGNQLRDLKAALYVHFTPTMSILLIDDGDGYKGNYAFVPYFNFGLDLSWKMLNVFVEGRWGSANYNMESFDDDFDDDFVYGDGIGSFLKSDKISARNAGIRVGIGLKF